MCFNKYSVSAYGYTSFGDGLNHFRSAARYSAALVGLLQGVRDIEHNGHTMLFHCGNISEVNHEVAIAEREEGRAAEIQVRREALFRRVSER